MKNLFGHRNKTDKKLHKYETGFANYLTNGLSIPYIEVSNGNYRPKTIHVFIIHQS